MLRAPDRMESFDPDVASSVIDDNLQLAAACARWSSAGVIGVDTEFVRERTYHPRPGLIQVADGRGVTLVDPLAISDFGPLGRLLVDPSVIKVMHAGDEDLEVLELLTGVMASGLFDTQLAGAFAGYGFSLSYGGLVGLLQDVVLDKGETRSDWLRRPLAPAQLRYAALDVVYLVPMYERLGRELAALGRAAWLQEELEHRRHARAREKRPEAAYLRVRRRGRLDPASHAALRALSHWREREAMARDLPRRHLMTDEVLIALASTPARGATPLENVQGLSRRFEARYGPVILGCIDAARRRGPEGVDAPVDLRPHAETISRLKDVARQESDARKLPPELVANRRAIETVLRRVLTDPGAVPREFQGWRFDVVTQSLLDCIDASR